VPTSAPGNPSQPDRHEAIQNGVKCCPPHCCHTFSAFYTYADPQHIYFGHWCVYQRARLFGDDISIRSSCRNFGRPTTRSLPMCRGPGISTSLHQATLTKFLAVGITESEYLRGSPKRFHLYATACVRCAPRHSALTPPWVPKFIMAASLSPWHTNEGRCHSLQRLACTKCLSSSQHSSRCQAHLFALRRLHG
jgi:hypothetical protein